MVGGQAALLAQSPFAGRFGPGGPGGHLRALHRGVQRLHGQKIVGRTHGGPAAASCPARCWPPRRRTAFSDDELVMALFAAAAIGRAIALASHHQRRGGRLPGRIAARPAGMAAAALTQLYGGSPEAAAHACAFALMNTLGLVCDPVGRAGRSTLRVPQRGRCVAGGERGSARAFGRGLPHPPGRDDSHHARCRRRPCLPRCARRGEGGCAGLSCVPAGS